MKRTILIAALAGLLAGVPIGLAAGPRLQHCEERVTGDYGEAQALLADGYRVQHAATRSSNYVLQRCNWP